MTFEEAIKAYAAMMEISQKEARQDAESLIESQMRLERCSREFAEATFIEEQEDANVNEIRELTNKAKENKTNKPKARAVDAFGKTRTRTIKQDDEKISIIQIIFSALQENFGENVQIINNQQKVDLLIGDNHYTLTLTKHRQKKTET